MAVAARRSLLLFVWQVACVATLAAGVAIGWGGRAGWSIVAGGGINLLWTLYMALTLLRHGVNYGAQVSAASFFKGWIIKIVLTVGLLIVALRSRNLEPLGVLSGLFAAMVAYWAWFAFDLQRRWSLR
jgi:F0F1-type ATP synthase assembly protein I